MYAEAYGLREEPFAPTPDPDYLVLTPDHREALAALEYGLRERRGFMSLIGEVGTGKTTILYTLLRRISGEIDTAFFSHTTLGFEDLLWAMLRDLGLEPRSAAKRELIATLDVHLHRQADAGRTTALIIDEAQNLSAETLEELRLLSNFETFRHKLLQIVLVGQPELEETLAQPRVRQLRDRIAVRATLRPLPRNLVPEYIERRLAVAGFDGSALFDRAALDEIGRFSSGVPRRINALCHRALLGAYANRAPRVDRNAVRAAARELDLDRGRARRTPSRAVTWAGVKRGVAAGAALATMALIASGIGFRAPVDASAPRMIVAANGCAPSAPRMTDPPRREGDRLVQNQAKSIRARAAGVVSSVGALVDWAVPSQGYQEWHRMHRSPSSGWSDTAGR